MCGACADAPLHPDTWHTAYISIGSNLGEKRKNCQGAVAELAAWEGTVLEACSAFYRTEPVDFTAQDWFVNCMVKIRTRWDPGQLLERLRRIERAHGRAEKRIRFGPRILDLDIVLFDGRVLCLPELTLPHPRMHKRRFVLQPMCDIDPDVVHPVLKRTMAQLNRLLDAEGQDLFREP